MKLCWLDLRKKNDLTPAVLEEAVHQRLDGVVASSVADLADLPPTVKKVLFPDGPELPEDFGQADIVIVTPEKHGEPAVLAARHPGVEFGRYVEIVDAATLEVACQAAATERWSLLWFRDPTKIPLEIVIAAGKAAKGTGSLITVAQDVEEAEIIFGVLELGSDGVMLAPAKVGDATALKASAVSRTPTSTWSSSPSRPPRTSAWGSGPASTLSRTSARTRASWWARTPRA